MDGKTVVRRATTLMLQLAVAVSVAACLSPVAVRDDGTADYAAPDQMQPRGIAPGPPPPLITRLDGARPDPAAAKALSDAGENP